MGHRTRSRQILLIMIAVLLPAGVLIGLARRVFHQESELARTRAAEERRNAVEQLARGLSARLEAIKLQEINRWIRVPAVSEAEVEQPPDAALVFVAPLDGDGLVLPWESRSTAKPTPEFVAYRHEGESFEFRDKNPSAARDAYRRARKAAGLIAESCEGMLLEARVLVKSANTAAAAAIYHSMLKDCDAVFDGEGMPFSLYAAERLIEAVKQPRAAHDYVLRRTNAARWTAPYEAYMTRSLLKSATGERAEQTRRTIESRIAELQRIEAFTREFHRVKPLAETAWVAYGDEPWLVRVVEADPPLPVLVFVVSSAEASRTVAPPASSLVTKDSPGSDSLGEGFHGLHVKWPPGQFDVETRGPSVSLYASGIAFILGITMLAGYLLLRDVRRDLRMAEVRSHFVASVSHELKTPLTAIRMFAETLALGRARDETTRSEYLDTIVNESERLTRLVENVLDFSKIEQGKKIYRMQPSNLADVVRSAARAMQYPLSQQGFTLNVSIDDTFAALHADADAMEQAILNLLSNAMKYSGSARQIDLSLRSAGAEAVIEVTDRGVGIDPQEQPLIFEKFYRSRSAETGLIAGTGLGLTVVQHVVHAHGGRVELRSAAGQGSTFSIRIPLPGAEAPA